uniref:Ribonuclease H-like domain-containing protein n=1 Tax=Tanacetum cinerariifolium TaxID=118510 RepID=A0A6L2KF73_TANCI|nr:ribonuclease H-like domain-containing protein [Tanacetum cinerariifolium]
MVQKPVWNNVMRVNHHNSTRLSHPYSNKNVVPTAVLTKTCLVSLNVARPVFTFVPQTTVNIPRPVKHVVHKAYSPIRRPINHRPTTKTSNFNQKITTVKVNKVNDVQGNPQHALKDKGVIYSGCSRHMTGNISYLSDFEEFNRGYVAFGGNVKGGKILGKGKIKTCKLDIDDVYFVKELKFNLFSVSQMCDKKNNVLFTDTKCVVLSSDFKLPDENHVLLRVPRENNMYNVDLKNVVPSRDLTYLFAKATIDEGLPSKIFENNHTCVACKKGKQHRASCKSKPVSSVSHPLQRTRIVQETLHINFLENQPTVARSGPKWLFDIDTLTQSMNYQPVVAENQPNPTAGIKENPDADIQNTNADVADAAFDVKENENEVHVSTNSSDKQKKHNEKATRDDKGKIHVDLSTRVRDLRDEFEEFFFNDTNRINAASAPVTAARPNLTNSTNSLTASPSDTAISPNFRIAEKSSFVDPSNYTDDPDMPALEDIEEGIDYDEVFTPVARIEAIRLFLAYASFMGFMVYQMNVKSAFLYGTIEKEVYVFQPLEFKDLDYPDKVYKVVKALYGLHQALRA